MRRLPSPSSLQALRAAPALAPVRWVLTTMGMALGLSMMFGVRPTEAFPDAPAASAAAAAAPTTAGTERPPHAAAAARDDDRGREDRARPTR